MGMAYCIAEDCTRLAQRNGLCWAHVRRRSRGALLSPPVRVPVSPWACVVDSAVELADSDSQDDRAYRRSEWRLRKATIRYAKALGYRRRTRRS